MTFDLTSDVHYKEKFENVCHFYKNGHCRFGVDCRKDHPKFWQKFIYNGLAKQNRKGCDGKCGKLHPNACRDSLKNRECSREKCKFYHLKGTKNTEYKPEQRNLDNKNQAYQNHHQNQNSTPTFAAGPVFQESDSKVVSMLQLMMEEMRSWRTKKRKQTN